MPGKFVVKESKKGFHFNLLATNGKVIATSEVYPTRRNCMQGIDSVRRNAPDATVVEQAASARAGTKTAASNAAAGNGSRGRAGAKKAVSATSTPQARSTKAATSSGSARRSPRTSKASFKK